MKYFGAVEVEKLKRNFWRLDISSVIVRGRAS